MRIPPLVLVAVLALAAPANAAIRYASPTSSDGAGTCATVATACTLAHALNAASSGSEIVILPGTYSASATLTPPGGVTIHGLDGSARPVIHTTAASIGLAVGYPGISRVKDLEIDGPSTNGLINLNGDGAFVENVVLHATGNNSTALVEYDVSGFAIVRDSIATASGTNAKAMWFGGQPSHVRNVTAWATGPGSTGLMSYAYHFTVSMSCVGQGLGNVDLASSIIHGDGKDLQLTKEGDCGSAPVLKVAYSDFTTKGETGATIDTSGGHNVSLDPATVFVAPGTDFHELEGAGTIDRGAVDDGTGTADVDDLDRVRGVIDMGAAEFFAPSVAILAPAPGPTFNGAVNPHGMATTAVFEFGPDTGYGSTSDAFSIAGDEAIHGVSVAPPGLDPAVAQHVRLKATQGGVNYTRTVYSADATYTPPATTTPPPTTGNPPPPGGSTAPKCKVPKLKGLTRKRARRRLIRAHCRLGKVRGRKGGKVRSQGRRAGRRLAAGTKVSIRLG